MPAVALRAHYDGDQICLDEPFPLERGSRLIVTVLTPSDEASDERDAWVGFSSAGLAGAYGPDEPEYSLDMVKEVNPYYEGG